MNSLMNSLTPSQPRSHSPPLSPFERLKANTMSSAFFKSGALRVAVFLASFAASSAVMVAVGSMFHAAGSDAVLRDTPQARATLARCEARPLREQRRDCVRHEVAQAQARDAGASMMAAASSSGLRQ
jgi:hypothetical protein